MEIEPSPSIAYANLRILSISPSLPLPPSVLSFNVALNTEKVVLFKGEGEGALLKSDLSNNFATDCKCGR